jgi:hypothetical protein
MDPPTYQISTAFIFDDCLDDFMRGMDKATGEGFQLRSDQSCPPCWDRDGEDGQPPSRRDMLTLVHISRNVWLHIQATVASEQS